MPAGWWFSTENSGTDRARIRVSMSTQRPVGHRVPLPATAPVAAFTGTTGGRGGRAADGPGTGLARGRTGLASRYSYTARATGPAAAAPKPPWSMMTPTAYWGWSAG